MNRPQNITYNSTKIPINVSSNESVNFFFKDLKTGKETEWHRVIPIWGAIYDMYHMFIVGDMGKEWNELIPPIDLSM